jgi:hypothetical protein
MGVKWLGSEADQSPRSNGEVRECVELYLHSTNMPSRRGAQLKKDRDNFILPLQIFLLDAEYTTRHMALLATVVYLQPWLQ